MTTISMSILVFIVLALVYTYWGLISSLTKHLQLHWLPLTLIIVFFLGLGSGLVFIIFNLFMAGTINAGSLLGMLFGITLILGTIRTFKHKGGGN